jgi:hypothetical protein
MVPMQLVCVCVCVCVCDYVMGYKVKEVLVIYEEASKLPLLACVAGTNNEG